MRLRDVCDVQMGYTPRGRLDPADVGGLPAIQLGDLGPDGGIDPMGLTRYLLDGVPERYLVREGDVLFRSRGERNTATVLDHRLAEPALAVLPIVVLRPNREMIEPMFLGWAINQGPAQRHFDRTARGTGLRMVPKSSLDHLEIDVPDLAIQRAIVELDMLAAEEQQLTSLLAERRRHLMSCLLVDLAKTSRAPGGLKGRIQ